MKRHNVIENSKEDGENRERKYERYNKITKKFDTVLEGLKKNEKNAKLISVKSRSSNINLHPLIKKNDERRKSSAPKWIMAMIKHLIFLMK